ncbi:MAG: gluconokinase [Clostridia bacterium]|nr:gluconokinase [Deltaproteobacteria bacterium]
MGVAGSGKSTFASALAERLHRPFIEGDNFHSADNHAKMARGEGLTDADRKPWLETLAMMLREEPNVVMACSALKRAYRDLLRKGDPQTLFVYMTAREDTLRARLTKRHGHFVDARLLDSQLTTLEPPAADENAIEVDATKPTAEAVAAIADDIGA